MGRGGYKTCLGECRGGAEAREPIRRVDLECSTDAFSEDGHRRITHGRVNRVECTVTEEEDALFPDSQILGKRTANTINIMRARPESAQGRMIRTVNAKIS